MSNKINVTGENEASSVGPILEFTLLDDADPREIGDDRLGSRAVRGIGDQASGFHHQHAFCPHGASRLIPPVEKGPALLTRLAPVFSQPSGEC